MKVWIDDVRQAPEGYTWIKTTNAAINFINVYSKRVDFDNNIVNDIELIDIDHDAGNCVCFGGDYIRILDYMEETGINDIPIRIHSMNPVGVENMRRIIQRNNWTEIV